MSNENKPGRMERLIRNMKIFPFGRCTLADLDNSPVETPEEKRVALRSKVENLIRQNPPRGETGDKL